MSRLEEIRARLHPGMPDYALLAMDARDLRDLLAVADAAREVRLAYVIDMKDWKRTVRAQLNLRYALARLNGAEVEA